MALPGHTDTLCTGERVTPATRRITQHLRGRTRRGLPGCPWRCRTRLRSEGAVCWAASGGQTPRLGAAQGHDVRAATTATDAPDPTRHEARRLCPVTVCAACAGRDPGVGHPLLWLLPSTPTSREQGPSPEATMGCHGVRPIRYAPGHTPVWLRKGRTHGAVSRSHDGSLAPSAPLDVGTREGEGKGRAMPLDTLHRNLARMCGENLPHNIEA